MAGYESLVLKIEPQDPVQPSSECWPLCVMSETVSSIQLVNKSNCEIVAKEETEEKLVLPNESGADRNECETPRRSGRNSPHSVKPTAQRGTKRKGTKMSAKGSDDGNVSGKKAKTEPDVGDVPSLETLDTQKEEERTSSCQDEEQRDGMIVTHDKKNKKKKSAGDVRNRTCEKCNRVFSVRYSYLRHSKRCSGIKIKAKTIKTKPSCPHCGKVLSNATALNMHVKIHTNDRPYTCPNCPRKFIQKRNLEIHIESIHDKKRRFMCHTCGQCFKQMSGLEYHQQNHDYSDRMMRCPGATKISKEWHLYKRYEVPCTICGELFTNFLRFLHHLKDHFSDQESSEELDSDEMKTAREILEVNSDILNKTSVHKCRYCDKIYRSKHDKNEHEKLHSETNMYPFSCKYCDKIFRSSSGCHIHQKTHRDKYELTCDKCGRVYENQSSFQRHESHCPSDHPTTAVQALLFEVFKCGVCSKSFNKLYSLQVHERTHSRDKQYSCVVCERAFTDPSNLIAHGKRKHPDSPRHLFSSSKREAYIHGSKAVNTSS